MLNKIRMLFAMMMMAGAATMLVSVDAYAAQGDPKEQDDGCDHGATGKECREDPSEKGKDCDVHGKNAVGGVNEDHCVTTTTLPGVTATTVPGVTATTVPGATDTTVPGTEDPAGPTDEEAPRTAAPPADDLPVTGTSADALAAFAGGLMIFGTGLRKLVK